MYSRGLCARRVRYLNCRYLFAVSQMVQFLNGKKQKTINLCSDYSKKDINLHYECLVFRLWQYLLIFTTQIFNPRNPITGHLILESSVNQTFSPYFQESRFWASGIQIVTVVVKLSKWHLCCYFSKCLVLPKLAYKCN